MSIILKRYKRLFEKEKGIDAVIIMNTGVEEMIKELAISDK